MMLIGALALALLAQHDDDRAALLAGVEVLERRGHPGTIAVYGGQAFTVIAGGGDEPHAVMAASRYGDGRVIALAHGAYLGEDAWTSDANGRLLRNALAWLGEREGPLEIGILGRAPRGVVEELAAEGHTVLNSLQAPPSTVVDVVIWLQDGECDRPDDLRLYVSFGAGLLCAVCPWGWEQVHSDRGLTLDDLPQNEVLRSAGLAFAPGTSPNSGEGGYAVAANRAELVHAGDALRAMAEEDGDAPSRLYLLEHALRSSGPAFRARIEESLGPLDAERSPRPSRPLERDDARTRLVVSAASRAWRDLAPEKVEPFAGVDEFPGAVPAGAERVTESFAFDAASRGWQSTGLYLAPGEVLELSTEAANGWRVRVGCHRDRLWRKDRWKRWPDVTYEAALADGITRVATPFGGPVYLVAPKAGVPLEVQVGGAVRAPFHRLGVESDWSERRLAAGPWAELEGRHVVLSVPSESVRALEDPGALLEFWDAVLVSHHELSGEPLPARKERFVADVQISAGYMHAGYPIMTHLDVAEPDGRTLNLELLAKEGSWGHFHELGHNLQEPSWTFAGTGEVTCNLFSLYSMHEVCGIEPWEHPWLVGHRKAAEEYLATGADFETWKRKPGVALMTYAELQYEFGWEPFREVLRGHDEPIRDDAAKVDAWVLRFSRAVGRDLRPHFLHWGWPLGEALRADPELAALEPWPAGG